MKLLFDIGHPAHVHLLKNFIFYLKENHHNIYVASRDKDVTNSLLNHYGIKYDCLSQQSKTGLGLLAELALRNYRILRMHRQMKFDAAFGTSVSIAHLSAINGVPSYSLNEDDDDIVPFYALLTYPFATSILNPKCIRFKKWSKKRVLYPSYHELAYLHPNNFSPERGVLEKYSLKEKEYILVRFSALEAHHDVGEDGISNPLWKKIQDICSGYKIVQSFENQLLHEIDSWDIHHLLAFAKMIISDSQTMAVEGAVLGVPTIRINTFVNRCSVLDELETKYQLTNGYHPNEEELAIKTISDVLNNGDVEEIWHHRRKKMLAEKVDYNEWLIDFFETEINVIK